MILCTLLNDPGEAARPMAEDTVPVIKSAVIPRHRNRTFDFVSRGKLPILQDFFQYANEPNVTWASLWRIRWVRNSEKMMLLEF
jgi:hypothetical protein